MYKSPDLKIHTFRKCCVSQLIANGNDIETVSKLVGHSSIGITKEFYLFETPEQIQTLNNFENELLMDLNL